MALAEPLRTCLDSLTLHCRALQVEKEVLFQETQKLKQQLASAPAAQQQQQQLEQPEPVAPPRLELMQTSSTLLSDAIAPAAQQHLHVPGSLQQEPGYAWTTPVASLGQNHTPKSEHGQCKTRSPDDAQADTKIDIDLLHVRTMGAARLGMSEDFDRQTSEPVEEGPSGLCRQIIHELFNDTEGDVAARGCSVERLVQSLTFRITCLILIVINSIFTGVRMDTEMRSNLQRIETRAGSSDADNVFFYIDVSFTIWFCMELCLRIVAERGQFIYGENRTYNLMDSVLVLLSVADMFLPRLPAASFLRLFRAFRIVRIARLVQNIQLLKPLRTMLFAIVNSFTALLWAFFMIALSMFIFSVLVGSAVLALFEECDVAIESERDKAMALASSFGNLYRTMITLFASITGGDDWMTAARQLRTLQAGEFYFAMFCFFIFFCLIGLLNVVNGIFVDSAVCTRTEDEVVQHFRDDEQRTSEEIRRIFQQGDRDGSGSITLQELQLQVKHPWVKAYFAGLDIDPREASIIFTLLDTDNSGELSIEEFVAGILKMKGSAKGVDVLAIMFDHQRLALCFNTLCSYLEDELREIKEAVKPGSGMEVRGPGKLLGALAALDKHGAKFIEAYDRKDRVRSSTLSALSH